MNNSNFKSHQSSIFQPKMHQKIDCDRSFAPDSAKTHRVFQTPLAVIKGREGMGRRGKGREATEKKREVEGMGKGKRMDSEEMGIGRQIREKGRKGKGGMVGRKGNSATSFSLLSPLLPTSVPREKDSC